MPVLSLPVPQKLIGHDILPWHHHRHAYAAIVIEGGYEEAGESGRLRVEAGDVIIHAPFSGHRNRIARSGARVMNVALTPQAGLSLTNGRVADPITLMDRLVEMPAAASDILAESLHAFEPERDLPDMLATALVDDPSLSITQWARCNGVPERTLRRQFALAYGISAKQFRARAKARSAWKRILISSRPLAEVALDTGFADQAHMSRSVRAMTGLTPYDWRLAATFKTDPACPV